MVNRQLRNDLLRKLKVTPQALSARAKVIRRKFGPMTTDDAVYLIAHREGLELQKYLDLKTLDRARALLPRPAGAVSAPPNASERNRLKRKNRALEIRYPLIDAPAARAAQFLGSDVYPTVFVLENSIRNLIRATLGRTPKWWLTKAPPNVRNGVARTMAKEAAYPYRTKRGHDELEYANFNDLKEIVICNAIDFQKVLPDLNWFKVRMEEVYMARNNLAHCVPLSDADITRIRLFAKDWAILLETGGVC